MFQHLFRENPMNRSLSRDETELQQNTRLYGYLACQQVELFRAKALAQFLQRDKFNLSHSFLA